MRRELRCEGDWEMRRGKNVCVVGLLMVVLVVAMAGRGFAGDVVYVRANAGAGGDGLSWASAFETLDAGLGAADPCDEVWVSEGTYRPDPCGLADRRMACFAMKNEVGIYGGFPDTGEPGMSDRDLVRYETILSGDIGVLGDVSDNCYHVFYHPIGTDLDESAVLDGV